MEAIGGPNNLKMLKEESSQKAVDLCLVVHSKLLVFQKQPNAR